jgi:hypothetical protein
MGTCQPERQARHHLALELSQALDWISTLAPAEANAVRAQLIEGERLKGEATQRLTALASEARSLEDAIVTRADARSRKADVEAQLAKANEVLGSSDCLNLPDGELVRFKMQQTLLPADIARWETVIADAAKEVARLEAAGPIAVATLIEDMIAWAKPDYSKSSYARNDQVVALANAGLLA